MRFHALCHRAVQVDPIKPNLKPPGTKRLKLDCDVLLSKNAFKFNLRRFNEVAAGGFVGHDLEAAWEEIHGVVEIGRGLHSFTSQLNLSAFYGIGGACRGCIGGVQQVRGGIRGY
jgi:hypothetical protein